MFIEKAGFPEPARGGGCPPYRVRGIRFQPWGAICAALPRLLAAVFGLTLALALAVAAEPPVRVVALGDSLTAGFGLPAAASFPARLEAALRSKGRQVEITNAGVSGDTTSGGLARLDWSVAAGTQVVILELGANDALRGVDPDVTRKALDAMLGRLKSRGIAVLLCGMLAPPNYGPDYARRFNAIYPELAAAYGVPLYPFFLEGVATEAALNQPDGLHPTAAGVDVIVRNVLPHVERVLDRVRVTPR